MWNYLSELMDMSSWIMLSLHTISFVRDYEKLKRHDQ